MPTDVYGVRCDATRQIVYVDKTIQGVDTRFQQHINSDHAQWAKGYTPETFKSGDWTPYESAVWEQHFMDLNGGTEALTNANNAITEAKYYKYKGLHNPC